MLTEGRHESGVHLDEQRSLVREVGVEGWRRDTHRPDDVVDRHESFVPTFSQEFLGGVEEFITQGCALAPGVSSTCRHIIDPRQS
jgi:hypothetical protein